MAQPKEKKWNWDLFDGSKGKGDKTDVDMSDAELEKLQELLERAVPLIEQVNSLYNQYRCGVERRPPIERRLTLDQIITSLQFMRKPSAAARFRVRQVIAKFLAYKDRWDRINKSMEGAGDFHRGRKGKGPIRRPGSGGSAA